MNSKTSLGEEDITAPIKINKPRLDSRRVILYSGAFLLAQAAVILALTAIEILKGREIGISLIGNDFRVFWSGSKLAIQGHGIDVYDINKLFPIQQAVTPSLIEAKPWQYWFYPPTFLLFVLPLSIIPYYLSFAAFNITGIILYLYVVRKIAPHKGATIVAMGFPATLFTIINGQNSFITASLAGLSLVLLERRPKMSGLLIGTLIIKPHLALLFVVALLCTKRWSVFIIAGCTALTISVASLIVFSPESGIAFLKNLHIAKSFAEHEALPLHKMPTIFSGAMLLGASVEQANFLHYSASLVATSMVAYVWTKCTAPYLRNSALIIGSLLISPHLFDYDLVWLAWPIAWITVHGLNHGWWKLEKELLILTWASPLLGEITLITSLQITPIILFALLYAILRRARMEQSGIYEPTSLSVRLQ